MKEKDKKRMEAKYEENERIKRKQNGELKD